MRRLLLLVAALLPGRRFERAPDHLPSITLVVAARNEAGCVASLTATLAALDYPAERLFTVLVDDDSSDETPARFAEWAAGRPRTEALALKPHAGQHQAQIQGMALDDGELVVLCDADLRPRPDCLRRLAGAFTDDGIGAAGAFLAPENAAASPISRYAAVESWVHQLVTSAGKDRLNLNPPALGCSAYRRRAIEQIGWFSPGPGADVRANLALTRAGWETRFVPQAVADNSVVQSWDDYWHQHIRWARNLFSTRSRGEGVGAPIAPGSRIESWMVSAGYGDRLALLAALPLIATGRLRLRFVALYLAVVSTEVCFALIKAGVSRDRHRFLLSTAAYFPLDVAASVAAALAHLSRQPRAWRHPRGEAPGDADR